MGVRFSVIVPTTGGRMANLDLVLTSLEHQWFPKSDYEVIVVNDGGEAQVKGLVASYAGKFGRLVYVVSPKFLPIPLAQVAPADVEMTMTIWGEGGDLVQMIPNEQPRNKGARIAENEFYIFADSDVILAPSVLALYNEDLTNNPNRVVLGIYHWLHPMAVIKRDVIERFDDVIHHRIQKVPLNKPQTHNICRDMRLKAFEETTPDELHQKPGHLNDALATLSGNICWPKEIFWSIGGYDPHLHAGAHEDGLSGLEAYFAGHALSYDKRIVGGHLYHDRNAAYIESFKWAEIKYLNDKFKDEPEFKGVLEQSEEEMRRLGVLEWKKNE